MASNFFGELFRITTFGESHGPAIGVVIDGCPAGVAIVKAEIDAALSLRRPGQNPWTSPRRETDTVEILSGVLEECATGAPIALLIRNTDAQSSAYTPLRDVLRPGHANFTYLQKYGIFDHRGGGRASARETAARVAAGAVAKSLLRTAGIDCAAYLAEAGGEAAASPEGTCRHVREHVARSPLFCFDQNGEERIGAAILNAHSEGDSVGGIVGCIAEVPPGLGDPVYGKLEAKLAAAMLSLPASKGFEIGSGFAAARMRGSQHNDEFFLAAENAIRCRTNRAGGTLGGISTGEPLHFRVAFKPTSSIRTSQATVTTTGAPTRVDLPEGSRHDPCVAIRAVPIVEAMTALVLADAWLLQRCTKMHR